MARPNQEAINTFISITGASEAVALRKLEQHGGDLNVAVNAHFSEGDRSGDRTVSCEARMGPNAPDFDDLPESSYDIEEEMIQGAIEASKQEAQQIRDPGHHQQSCSRLEDAELAHAVSLSLKTAEQEKALHDQKGKVGASEAESSEPAEVELWEKMASNGRLRTGSSSAQDDGSDAEEQPLVMHRSRNASSSLLESAKEVDVDDVSPPSSPVRNEIGSHSQHNGSNFPSDEWGGISSEERDEAVMLEAAMFGGVPEGTRYRFPYAPHQYMQQRDPFPRCVPCPPSPASQALQHGGDLNVAVNTHFSEGDRNISCEAHIGTNAPDFDDLPEYIYDIEEEMIQGAIEASKLEAQQMHNPDRHQQGCSHLEDAELAHAVSLSLKTAEQEKALHEQKGKVEASEAESSEPAEVELWEKMASNGRLRTGSSSMEDEGSDAGEQPLVRHRSRGASSSLLKSAEEVDVDDVPSSPVWNEIGSHSQHNGSNFPSDEWGGISSEEHDEAVMLEAAMLGGVPEGTGYRIPYAPHQYMQRRDPYPCRMPRPPSPPLQALQHGGDLNAVVNTHFREGDRNMSNAPDFDDLPEYIYDIEEEMIQGAIEASKLEAQQIHDPGRHQQSCSHLEDAELARAVSLSLKTAEQEKALHERKGKVGASEAESSEPAEVELWEKVASNGRLRTGSSSVEDEGSDAGEQPLVRHRSRGASSSLLESAEEVDVDDVPSSPVWNEKGSHSQHNGSNFPSDEWGGISSEEHDEAVMLGAVMLGGVPEGTRYRIPYAPHQYMQQQDPYPFRMPRPPSPPLQALQHGGDLNAAVNAHFSEGDRNIVHHETSVATHQDDLLDIDDPIEVPMRRSLFMPAVRPTKEASSELPMHQASSSGNAVQLNEIPNTNIHAVQTASQASDWTPSAPPIDDEIVEVGPVHYPSTDSSPVDLSCPPIESISAKTDGKKEDGVSSSCVICEDAPAEGACIPCGHMAGCMSCLNEIKGKNWDCPVCRKKIDQVIRVYVV